MFNSQDLTDDAFLGGKLRILQPRKGYRAGVDAVFLGATVAGPGARAATLLDVGAGVGTAGLCAVARTEGLEAVLLERETVLAGLAAENVMRNGLEGRCRVIEGDLETLTNEDLASLGAPPQSFDHVIANPPYHTEGDGTPAGSALKARSHAMAEASLESWCRFLARMAKPSGTQRSSTRRMRSRKSSRVSGHALAVSRCCHFIHATALLLFAFSYVASRGRERPWRSSRARFFTKTELASRRALPMFSGLALRSISTIGLAFGAIRNDIVRVAPEWRMLRTVLNSGDTSMWPFSRSPVIPVLRLSGPIGLATPLRPGISLSVLAGAIERTFGMSKTPAVAVIVNSPGGSPVQSI